MRPTILPLAGLLLCLAALLPASALATAGSYEVEACNAAPGGVNHSWVWSSTDSSPSDHFAKHESCPYPTGSNGGKADQESGLATTDALGLHDGAPPNTSAAWTFSLPEDSPLEITGITAERFLGHEEDPDNYWVPALRADGTIVPGESCLDTVGDAESCYVGGPPGHGEEPAVITGLSAHQLSYGITCVAEAGTECVTGATEHKAWAAMYGARVTISDPTTPTLSSPTGALWEPATYHKGTQTVDVEAGDTGGGIKSITLSADGKTIETYEAVCDYTYTKPCPTSTGTQTVALPTTQLGDGTHTITLTATDAAGVETNTSEQITIANEPPPAPTDLTASSSFGNDSYQVSWIDPPGQVAPIDSATYEVCHDNEEPANCTTPTSAGPEGPLTIDLPDPGTWTVIVWLTNAAGNTNRANAARLTIPLTGCCSTPELHTEAKASPPTTTTTPGPEASTPSTSPIPPSAPPAPAPRLHAHATLRGKILTVHITASTRIVTVHYKLREPRHRLTSSRTWRIHLRNGHATASFRLPKRLHPSETLLVIIQSTLEVVSIVPTKS
jgi:hypothetical protein